MGTNDTRPKKGVTVAQPAASYDAAVRKPTLTGGNRTDTANKGGIVCSHNGKKVTLTFLPESERMGWTRHHDPG